MPELHEDHWRKYELVKGVLSEAMDDWYHLIGVSKCIFRCLKTDSKELKKGMMYEVFCYRIKSEMQIIMAIAYSEMQSSIIRFAGPALSNEIAFVELNFSFCFLEDLAIPTFPKL